MEERINMNLQPTHDLLFIDKDVRALRAQEGSLIMLPDNVSEQNDVAIVVAVGPGKTYSNGDIVPLTVQVGDKVIHSKHAGQAFKLGDKDLLAIREHDVYAILDRE